MAASRAQRAAFASAISGRRLRSVDRSRCSTMATSSRSTPLTAPSMSLSPRRNWPNDARTGSRARRSMAPVIFGNTPSRSGPPSMARSPIRAEPPRHRAMRTRERIIVLAALGLGLGLTPGFAFEGTSPPDVIIVPAPASPTVIPAPRRAISVDVPRPPAPIPRGAAGVSPVLMPDSSMPRANPMVPPPGTRTLPPPSVPAFAAPAAPITPIEALRSGTRALKDGHKEKALVSLEYAAEQGVIAAQWKLARMYAEGDGVEQSDLRAFEYFSRIADAHADPT